MRRTTLMIGRVVSLCLAFVLGFFSAFGAIAGGIYLVYSTVSLEKLNEWGEKFGFSLPLDDFVDPDAEMPATSLTISDLLAEIRGIQNDKLTLEDMIERYGLILPADFVDKMPPSVKSEIPFTALFSEDGINAVMESITVTDVIDMIPSEIASNIISNPARDALSDNTLAEIVAMDMGHIFEGIQLGYITGVNYVLDENGVYQVVWADENDPTLLELIAPLDLGGILCAVSDGEGNVFEVIENSIGDVTVNSIFETFMADITMLSNLLGEATIGDLIVFDPERGEYTLDFMAVMDGRKVGSLLGYTEVESTDPESLEVVYSWIDADGNKVKGISKKLADIYLSDFMNGKMSVDSLLNDLVLADVLGYDESKILPVFMSDNLEEQVILDKDITIWYTNGMPADKIMNSFADKNLSWLSTSVSTLTIADILGYHLYDGEWYSWGVESVNGSDAIVLSRGSSVMAEIAGTPIGELGEIESTLKDIKIATLLGYTSITDNDGVHMYWSTGMDENGNPIRATGITASLADLSINDLADGSTLQSTIDDISLADVMGYTQGEDGKWYKGGEVVSGPMAALAGSKIGTLSNDINNIEIGEMLGYTPVYTIDSEGNEILSHWEDSLGNSVDGIMTAFVGLTINDMKNNETITDAVQHIKVSDVMGFNYVNGSWYNKSGEAVTGVMAAIADCELRDISTKMEHITVGEMLNLHQDEETGKWFDDQNKEASGIVGAIAGTSLMNLNSRLDEIKVGEILGFTYNENENRWYNGTTVASGVTGALASSDLKHLNENLNHLLVGEIAGYTKLSSSDPNATEGEGWYVYNEESATYTKASGVLAELSDLTVNQLSNPDGSALTDSIGNVSFAEAIGYKKINGSWYDKDGKPVEGLLATLADKPINSMGDAINNLTINDVIPESNRGGILAIIDPETNINSIDTTINDAISETPLQFFIDNGLIEFDADIMDRLDAIANTLGGEEITVITEEMEKSGYYDGWLESHTEEIPTWRTQKLTKSFDYIVRMLTPKGI